MNRKLHFNQKLTDHKSRLFLRLVFCSTLLISLLNYDVMAIPSYARQTGLTCRTCHTVYPQLTAFGRNFKLNGYTLVSTPTIKDQVSDSTAKEIKTFLNLLSEAPISGMFQAGSTTLKKKIPNSQNNNLEFPQQLSLFYSGQIAPKLGAFVQMTLDNGSGTIGLDNTELRYANQSKGNSSITYGFTLNNNPTMQDLWNTTPAWGYPFTSSGIGPTPAANTMIEDLGGTVAGLGAFTMINNTVYLEISGYKTAQLGAQLPPGPDMEGAIKGTAPYWRAAIQRQLGNTYLQIGTFGMATKLFPTGVSGATDNFNDMGFDSQIEMPAGSFGQFILRSSFIHEKRTLNASFDNGDSENLNNTLNKLNLNASLFLEKGFNFTLGYFNTTGSVDKGIFTPESVGGSNNGNPGSSGFRTQFDYIPWQNVQLSLQYFAYQKFNGLKTNYDGESRNASDNNMLYFQLWLAF